MADPPGNPAVADLGAPGPRDRGLSNGTPRWVKVSGAIALAVVLLMVALMVFGGGRHGPGRHLPAGGLGGHPPAHSVFAEGAHR
ncbi:MAG: hypothetical protein M3Z25_12785 [Actinomycetota bacterium]|nr:hypothetical protein [Actinomycetota bacterium]